jgi:hypothetical protein
VDIARLFDTQWFIQYGGAAIWPICEESLTAGAAQRITQLPGCFHRGGSCADPPRG